MTELAASYTISPSDDSTLAIEVAKTAFRRRTKHILCFDKFSGEITFGGNDPLDFRIALIIDPQSITCGDRRLSERKRRRVADFARSALATNTHREIRFTSSSVRAKPLRGFVIEGVLQICGITRVAKVNAVLNEKGRDYLQIDGDTTFRLSDFDLPKPSFLFGLFDTKDEVVVRLLLWALPTTPAPS